jgi:potassium-transporting ATPase KdpC subunit
MIKDIILKSVKALLLFTVITGVIYPLAITAIGQIILPFKSNGSLISVDNKVIGSELIAQKFENDKYFQSRPSITDFTSLPSGGSNLAIASLNYKEKSDSMYNSFKEKNMLPKDSPVPSEMMSYSASGNDPHISKQAALLQVNRISKARNFDESKRNKILNIIDSFTEKPQFGILGQERINVLMINLEIDKL